MFAGPGGGGTNELGCGVDKFGAGGGGVIGSGTRTVGCGGGAVMDLGASTGDGATGASLGAGTPVISPHATAGTTTTAAANTVNLPVNMESREAT